MKAVRKVRTGTGQIWVWGRSLTGQLSGNGKMTHGRGTKQRVRIRMWEGRGPLECAFWVEAKDGRNEKLCGIKWPQVSERPWLRGVFSLAQRESWPMLLSALRRSQQAWSGCQNGCLGKVLCASVEPGWKDGGEVRAQVWWEHMESERFHGVLWLHSYVETSGQPLPHVLCKATLPWVKESYFPEVHWLSKMKGVSINKPWGPL